MWILTNVYTVCLQTNFKLLLDLDACSIKDSERHTFFSQFYMTEMLFCIKIDSRIRYAVTFTPKVFHLV